MRASEACLIRYFQSCAPLLFKQRPSGRVLAQICTTPTFTLFLVLQPGCPTSARCPHAYVRRGSGPSAHSRGPCGGRCAWKLRAERVLPPLFPSFGLQAGRCRPREQSRALPARTFPYGPKREETVKMPQFHYAAWPASERPHQDTVESIMDVFHIHWPAAK
jgi:hypothetical protein